MFSRLISDVQDTFNPREPPDDGGAVTPATPPRSGGGATPPGRTPDHHEAQALAHRYLEAGRREWERHNWGSAGLFAGLALEWSARASEDLSQDPTVQSEG